MKVGIVIITYNISTEVFILQIEAIKKFCKDEYVIHIIDNSSNLEIAKDIKYHAENFGLDYCKTFSSSINSSDSHSFAANLAYQKLKSEYDYFAFLDHDLLPVKFFSVVDILNGGHVIAGLGQGALKKYFWPGVVFFHLEGNDKDIIDFNPSNEFHLDTGGNLYKVVDKYGIDYCIFFNEAYHQNPNFISKSYDSYAMINDGMFLHFINASNWIGAERHEERINSLLNIAREKTGL